MLEPEFAFELERHVEPSGSTGWPCLAKKIVRCLVGVQRDVVSLLVEGMGREQTRLPGADDRNLPHYLRSYCSPNRYNEMTRPISSTTNSVSVPIAVCSKLLAGGHVPFFPGQAGRRQHRKSDTERNDRCANSCTTHDMIFACSAALHLLPEYDNTQKNIKEKRRSVHAETAAMAADWATCIKCDWYALARTTAARSSPPARASVYLTAHKKMCDK